HGLQIGAVLLGDELDEMRLQRLTALTPERIGDFEVGLVQRVESADGLDEGGSPLLGEAQHLPHLLCGPTSRPGFSHPECRANAERREEEIPGPPAELVVKRERELVAGVDRWGFRSQSEHAASLECVATAPG